MKICILVEDAKIDEVRRIAIEKFPILETHSKVLGTALSPTGELPATHWFCFFIGPPALVEKVLAEQNLSEMQVSSSKTFLEEKGLKKISS